jgi:general secretion pathway protein I
LSRKTSPEPDSKESGFTILEVLVAIAVVATSLTAIGMLTGVTTRGVRSIEQHVALVETARSVAAILPPPTQFSGEATGDLYGSKWRMSVSPFSGGGAVPESVWIPATLSIRVQSPTGDVLDLQTVRLLRKRE